MAASCAPAGAAASPAFFSLETRAGCVDGPALSSSSCFARVVPPAAAAAPRSTAQHTGHTEKDRGGKCGQPFLAITAARLLPAQLAAACTGHMSSVQLPHLPQPPSPPSLASSPVRGWASTPPWGNQARVCRPSTARHQPKRQGWLRPLLQRLYTYCSQQVSWRQCPILCLAALFRPEHARTNACTHVSIVARSTAWHGAQHSGRPWPPRHRATNPQHLPHVRRHHHAPAHGPQEHAVPGGAADGGGLLGQWRRRTLGVWGQWHRRAGRSECPGPSAAAWPTCAMPRSPPPPTPRACAPAHSRPAGAQSAAPGTRPAARHPSAASRARS